MKYIPNKDECVIFVGVKCNIKMIRTIPYRCAKTDYSSFLN